MPHCSSSVHVQVLEAMSLEQQLVQEEEELRFLESKGKKSEDEQLQLEADVDQLLLELKDLERRLASEDPETGEQGHLQMEQGFRSGPCVRN